MDANECHIHASDGCMEGINLASQCYHQRISVHNRGANTIIAVQNCPHADMKKVKSGAETMR